MRQWVLSFHLPPRFLFASRPEVMSQVLGAVYRVIAQHLTRTLRPSAKPLSLTTSGKVRYLARLPTGHG